MEHHLPIWWYRYQSTLYVLRWLFVSVHRSDWFLSHQSQSHHRQGVCPNQHVRHRLLCNAGICMIQWQFFNHLIKSIRLANRVSKMSLCIFPFFWGGGASGILLWHHKVPRKFINSYKIIKLYCNCIYNVYQGHLKSSTSSLIALVQVSGAVTLNLNPIWTWIYVGLN